MSYCINPNCSKKENKGKPLYCQACGSELLLHGRYRVVRVLGGGGFGITYEVDDSGLPKVLKVLTNNIPKAIELFQQESLVLSRLQHPGIPKVESDGYFTYLPRDSEQPLYCLIMEKIEGVNLDEYMRLQRSYQPISELTAINWLKQLVQILHQVHQQQYFHRDIKPANIMLRNSSLENSNEGSELVLIDFGTAREVTQTFMQKLAGQEVTGIVSLGYTPPEQMNGRAVPQSDFYALGRTFIFLLTGRSPNSFPEDPQTGELVWRNHAPHVSQQFGNLIDYLVAPFPGNRPKDTNHILDCLVSIDKNLTTYPSNKSNKIEAPDNSTLSYAAFWKRSLAYLIDYVILVIGAMIISAIVGSILISLFPQMATLPDSVPKAQITSTPRSDAVLGGFFVSTCGLLGLLIVFVASDPPLYPIAKVTSVITLILQWLYFVWLESSSLQATIGKMPLRIIATNTDRNRLTFAQANIRYWSKTISALLLFIGYIVAIFTQKKQALHDIIANSVIVNKY